MLALIQKNVVQNKTQVSNLNLRPCNRIVESCVHVTDALEHCAEETTSCSICQYIYVPHLIVFAGILLKTV